MVKTAFYISVAVICILIFVITFMYLRIVKARVQAQILKEEIAKEREAMQAEYESKGVNTFKASDLKKED